MLLLLLLMMILLLRRRSRRKNGICKLDRFGIHRHEQDRQESFGVECAENRRRVVVLTAAAAAIAIAIVEAVRSWPLSGR
jgi:hypothetical protein